MKTIIILLSSICLFFFSVEAQNKISICSGSGTTLEIASYIPGTTFSWFQDNVSLNVLTSKYIVPPITTSSQISKKYTCYLRLQGMLYDTVDFVLTVNPITLVDVTAADLCEGKLAKLTYSNQPDIVKQTWTIGSDTFSGKSVDYLCGTAPLNVQLQVENKFGCLSEVKKTFPVSLKPAVTIDEKTLTQNSLKGIYCGNSLAEYEVKGLTGNARVTGWKLNVNNVAKVSVSATGTGKIVPADKSLVEWVEVTANGLKVKWIKTNTSYNVKVIPSVSNGYCEYTFEANTILINDNTPDLDSVYQKPNKSSILIYPSGQSKTEMNYEWGYTTPAGADFSVKKSKVFYQEYNNLAPSNRYWVETWFTSNEVCRIRNYVTRIEASDTKSAMVFQFFPNPVESDLNIEIDQAVEGWVEIHDLTGVKFRSVNVSEGTKGLKINLAGIKAGIYVIRYIGNSGETLVSDSFIIK